MSSASGRGASPLGLRGPKRRWSTSAVPMVSGRREDGARASPAACLRGRGRSGRSYPRRPVTGGLAVHGLRDAELAGTRPGDRSLSQGGPELDADPVRRGLASARSEHPGPREPARRRPRPGVHGRERHAGRGSRVTERVRVAVSPGALRARWPKVRLEVVTGACAEIQESVAAGKSDLGLVLEGEPGGPPARMD